MQSAIHGLMRHRAARIGLPVFAGLAMHFTLHIKGKVLHTDWMAPLVLLVPIVVIGFLLARKEARSPVARGVTAGVVLSIMMALFLFDEFPWHQPSFFYMQWLPTVESGGHFRLDHGLMWAVSLSAVFGLLMMRWSRGNVETALRWLLVGAQAWAAFSLLTATNGEPIYRDDHPSFIYRLWMFGETFPRLLNYHPYWNAGVADFVGVSSGANGFGLVTWPLWWMGNPESVYTYALCLVFILLVPFLAVWAIRGMGGSRAAASIAGILALGTSQYFFLWLLTFGTVGALLATAFLLPLSGLLLRVVWYRGRSWRLGAGLVVALSMLCMWPPGVLMAVPMLLSMVISPRWTRTKFVFLAVCGCVVFALHARPLWHVLTEESSPLAFVLEQKDDVPVPVEPKAEVDAEAVHDHTHDHAHPSDFAVGWNGLRNHLREANPVLTFFGIAGLCFLPWRSVRRWYLPALGGLAFLAGWGMVLYPNMQLDRMGIPLLMLSILPASLMVGRVMQDERKHTAIIRGFLFSMLILGAWNVGFTYQNRAHARYMLADDDLMDLVDFMNRDEARAGRVLFAGRTVHSFGGGHVALLPLLTDREMVACDYYHFPPEQVEYQMPPNAWKTTEDDTYRYLELMDVTLMVTRHPDWIDYFNGQPDRYRQVREFGDKRVFRVKRRQSRFEEGEGTVVASLNQLEVELSGELEDVILRYRWADGLKADQGVVIEPVNMGPGVDLIRARTGGVRAFRITF